MAILGKTPGVDFSADQDNVPVPKPIAEVLDSLVKAAAQEQGRNRRNTAALITGGSTPKHPAISQWLDAYEWFVGWAHLDRLHLKARKLPSDLEVLARMRVVEDVIEVRTKIFFENVHSVAALLAEINAVSEEDV